MRSREGDLEHVCEYSARLLSASSYEVRERTSRVLKDKLELVPVQRIAILVERSCEKETKRSSRAHTGEGLNTKPEHGKNDPRYDAKIAEPESKRGPIEDREGYVEPGTDSPIEDHDAGYDKVTKSYRWKGLAPGTGFNPLYLIQISRMSETHQLNPIASIELASS